MKTIKVKTDPKTQEAYLELSDFADVVDISKVEYYQLKENKKDPSLVLTFYDKKKKKLPTKKPEAKT
jgi:hypothetical protein